MANLYQRAEHVEHNREEGGGAVQRCGAAAVCVVATGASRSSWRVADIAIRLILMAVWRDPSQLRCEEMGALN